MTTFRYINQDKSWIMLEQSRPIPLLSFEMPGESFSHNQSLYSAFSTALQTFASLKTPWITGNVGGPAVATTRRINDRLSKSTGWNFLPTGTFQNFSFLKNCQVACVLYITSQVNIFVFYFIPCSHTFHCSVQYSYWKNKLEQLISENSFSCCLFGDLLIKGLWEYTVILKLWNCLGIWSWQVTMIAYSSQENICNGN